MNTPPPATGVPAPAPERPRLPAPADATPDHEAPAVDAAHAPEPRATCAPVLLALGVTVLGWGFLVGLAVSACGLLLCGVALALWRSAAPAALARAALEAPEPPSPPPGPARPGAHAN